MISRRCKVLTVLALSRERRESHLATKPEPMRAARRSAAPCYAALDSLGDCPRQEVRSTAIVPVGSGAAVLNVFTGIIPGNSARREVDNFPRDDVSCQFVIQWQIFLPSKEVHRLVSTNGSRRKVSEVAKCVSLRPPLPTLCLGRKGNVVIGQKKVRSDQAPARGENVEVFVS